jgi:hypothetical protein
MEIRITRRIFALAALSFWISGCTGYDTVQDRNLSEDGQFWTEFDIQHTGSLDYDWKAITIGKTRPRWIDVILGGKLKEICALHGHGQLTMTWTDAKHLEVVCAKCDEGAFFPSSNHWQGVSIMYIYNGKPIPINIY